MGIPIGQYTGIPGCVPDVVPGKAIILYTVRKAACTMIEIHIPGRDTLRIDHLVLDFNGTIAADGKLIEGVQERLQALLPLVDIHVLTADTYGTAQAQCGLIGLTVETFPRDGAAKYKKAAVERLSGVCAIGNGYNDVPMFDRAELAVAVVEREGMCASLLLHADVLVNSITDALELLLKPDRLRATLRS